MLTKGVRRDIRVHPPPDSGNYGPRLSYRWVDHTGELELEIEAPAQEDVFRDATAAFAQLVGEGVGGDPVKRELRLEGGERAVLLVDWLDELVYLAETEGLVAEDVSALELSDGGMTATLIGHVGNPRHLVKGATYHRLVFEQVPQGFRARVVLDV